jgi:hypothetical protein
VLQRVTLVIPHQPSDIGLHFANKIEGFDTLPLQWLSLACERYFAPRAALLIARIPRPGSLIEYWVELERGPAEHAHPMKIFLWFYLRLLEATADWTAKSLLRQLSRSEQYQRLIPNPDLVLEITLHLLQPYVAPGCALGLLDLFLQRHAPEACSTHSPTVTVLEKEFIRALNQWKSRCSLKVIDAIKSGEQRFQSRIVQGARHRKRQVSLTRTELVDLIRHANLRTDQVAQALNFSPRTIFRMKKANKLNTTLARFIANDGKFRAALAESYGQPMIDAIYKEIEEPR